LILRQACGRRASILLFHFLNENLEIVEVGNIAATRDGVRLDVEVDWEELAAILRDAYLMASPKRLANAPGRGEAASPAREARHVRLAKW
jgi:hypothetical protein